MTSVNPAIPIYTEFLRFEPNYNITAKSTDVAHVGDYEVTLRATMDLFPTKFSETTFTLTIRFCFLNSLTPPVINPRTYQVTADKLEIQWTNFVQDPNYCEHKVKYEYYLVDEFNGEVTDLKGGRNLPDWLRLKDGGYRFDVLTSNDEYVGKYTLQVKAVIEDKYFAVIPLQQAILEIELEIFAKDFTVAPQEGLALKDHDIDMYEDMFYPIGRIIPSCPPNTNPSVTTSRRGTEDFLKWNSRTRTFEIERDAAGKNAVGTHAI